MTYDVLTCLKGKVIDRVDRDEHDQFTCVHFTDETMWLIVPKVWNCSGVKLQHIVGTKHSGVSDATSHRTSDEIESRKLNDICEAH
jgi:hypothetical protein